ncbi:KdsC family phosphatase [Sulfurospirillum multivorans]|uniref:3-deoxy-D-manno-octulosonate 8-phosphate phosphatase KdsC n=2 Tax=Sulfurospirillum multivorans TaxID=66821 RepID=A0AA86AKC0_SULMK|nr:HAD hydrolase family protein [Sulfurospirillum multivorans]AHJ12136.1 3-deoxy-D-manno-octulosonate 8-phosphate phosphatase [Sulfurospirillum multivorans DSM 12446]QEH05637.1 3-deoxy-D-manno-octulosonate 8-phosphate phosphatase [Sulfurospirillum multivorans]
MIELLVFDVDGCLTDGGIMYGNSETEEFKTFHVKDGFGIVSWMKLGRKSAIITGRSSDVVTKRAKELGITHLYQDVKDKKAVLQAILNKEGLGFENVAAIGDDLNDLSLLRSVGLSFCPKDAMPLIQKEVDVVLSKEGGRAAVREMIDIVVEKENLSEAFVNLWL